ncbi:hypothetical protein [Nitrospira sp.]
MKSRKTYQRGNRRLRNAARMMHDIRDAQAMINTYDLISTSKTGD